MQWRRQDWNYRTPNSKHIFHSRQNSIKTDPEYTEREYGDCIRRDHDKDQWRFIRTRIRFSGGFIWTRIRISVGLIWTKISISAGFVRIRVRISGGFICIRIGINDWFIWIRIRSVADSRALGNKPLVADSWVHGTQTAGSIKRGDLKYMASN